MSQQGSQPKADQANGKPAGIVVRLLNLLETFGNKLPDPAVLFLIGLVVTWGLSWLFSLMSFTEIDPRSGEPIEIVNLLGVTGVPL